MKPSEILGVIAKKIEGQGTNVDAGSVLPSILKAIVENGASKVEVDDFEEFDTTTAYSEDDIVRNDGKLHIFTADKSAGAWDASKVSQTSVFGELSEGMQSFAESLSELWQAWNSANIPSVVVVDDDEISTEENLVHLMR